MPEAKSNLRWWIISGVIVIASIIIYWRSKDKVVKQNTSHSSSSPSSASALEDQNLLIGRWTRIDSDGAYVIEIKSVGTDGKLAANYFNPRPIKVGHAEWKKNNNGLMVVVELRDVNYPGSTYTLNFIPSENRMTGNYYQAVEAANFDVEFVRAQ